MTAYEVFAALVQAAAHAILRALKPLNKKPRRSGARYARQIVAEKCYWLE